MPQPLRGTLWRHKTWCSQRLSHVESAYDIIITEKKDKKLHRENGYNYAKKYALKSLKESH